MEEHGMTEWSLEASLFGGPLDGRKVDLTEPLPTLRLPLVPSATLASHWDEPSAEGPAVAVYIITGRTRLNMTPAQAFMRGIPEHRTVAATYEYRP